MDDDPPLDEFVFGGCVLVQPFFPPPDTHETFFPADVVPPPILSASGCTCELLPSDDVERERADEAAVWYYGEWGIPADRVEAFLAWQAPLAAAGRIRREAFSDLEVARDYAHWILPAHPDLRLLGMGLHRVLLGGLLEAIQEEVRGRLHVPRNGAIELVRLAEAFPPGGRHLGYDVLDVCHYEQRHSWHCHGLERKMRDEEGTRLAPFGMIASHADACHVAGLLDRKEVGCEDGVWRAWRIVEYALDQDTHRPSAPHRTHD